MRIQMRSQNGRIGIETQAAQLEIDQKQPELELEITHPKVSIESTLPKVEISQQQAFSESGLKGVLELTFENAQIARQLMLGGIARAVSQGDELADVSKPDPLPDHARYNSWEQFKRDYNMVTMPKSGPDIQVVEGENDIQVEQGTIENKTQIERPTGIFEPGSVNIFMIQYPKLEIWTTQSKFDMFV
ncbi:DUF6470 family protein [Fusibacter sp. JL216-2]|uniref:DUF6470 family protein n=1 Tax=Fusibacter sp. JL216-2 TaxID=3071453 RepID=UPI003D3443A2